MALSTQDKGESKLLCSKGLARRQGLIDFIEPRTSPAAEDMETGGARGDLLLRHDDGVVREVFNARCGELTLLNSTLLQSEIAKREALLGFVYRLYRVGRTRTPVELRRELQHAEVESVISCFQRLSFMGSSSSEDLVAHCEESGSQDGDVLAHVMDPLQLRYLLTFHRSGTREELRSAGIDTLIGACQRRDPAAVHAWFRVLTGSTDSLPGDAPQYFRSILLELWKSGGADLGALAVEIAILDAQLFDDLGWESTRAFCAQLRRVTGPGCEALDAFLTDEDVDGALVIAEELKQDDLVQHFRKLVNSYSTKLHRDLRRNVMSAAGQARAPETDGSESASPVAGHESAFRPLGYAAAS